MRTPEIPLEAKQPMIERAIVIQHPLYEEAAKTATLDLERAGFSVSQFESKLTVEDNIRLIRDSLKPGDVVVVEAGDGTYNKLAAAALNLASSQSDDDCKLIQGIAFCAGSKGGNGRDGARSERGLWHKNARPSWVLKNSVQVPAWGMEVTGTRFTEDGKGHEKFTEIARSYIGIGRTAAACALMETDKYRNDEHKRRRDVKLARTALFSMPDSFVMVDEEGESHTLSDLTYGMGHAVGKGGWLPTELWEKEIVQVMTEPGRYNSLRTAVRAIANRLPATRLRKPSTVRSLDHVLIHIDGDKPFKLYRNTPLTVGMTDVSYNVLTTRYPRLVEKPGQDALSYI